MRTFLLILAISFFTTGCKNKDGIPNAVLSQKKMQSILWDMVRVDQFLTDYVLNKDSSLNKITESLKYYQQIFAIHKVSKEEFQYSFSFYKSHPALLKPILDSIGTPLNEVPVQPVKPDSVPVPVIPVQDTIIKKPIKILQDTITPQKRKRPLLRD